ncbi:MAG: hypothetical protein HC844_01435 [Tabrizicola sp.]|nr:hypothetical protein [Tabrizicola sp.]
MNRFALPVLILLAACGTPQEQCINRNTRDLRTVERLIDETEGNLARGYAYEEVTITTTQWGYCPVPVVAAGQKAPPPRLCLDDVSETVRRPKAIDLAEEARKLDGLKTKRRQLARAAEAVIAQCKAAYPE